MARRRGFGEVERRVSATGGGRPTARGTRCPTAPATRARFATKMDAEAWLAAERALIDRDEWTPPQARKAAEPSVESARRRPTRSRAFAERYLAERGLRPTTVRGYESLLPRGSCPTSARCRCAT